MSEEKKIVKREIYMAAKAFAGVGWAINALFCDGSSYGQDGEISPEEQTELAEMIASEMSLMSLEDIQVVVGEAMDIRAKMDTAD